MNVYVCILMLFTRLEHFSSLPLPCFPFSLNHFRNHPEIPESTLQVYFDISLDRDILCLAILLPKAIELATLGEIRQI